MRDIFLYGVFIFSLGTSFYAHAGKAVGNGGDAFDVGGNQIKVFEQIEFTQPMYPPSEPAYVQIILPQLDRLSKVLPITAAYLKFVFESGAMWYLVDATLKDVDTTGDTNIVLSYQKIQAAVTDNGVTQINRKVWNSLSLESQAYLLIHEMLWTADAHIGMFRAVGVVGQFECVSTKEGYCDNSNSSVQINSTLQPIFIVTSEQIRNLTSTLLNPFVDKYRPNILSDMIQSNAGSLWHSFGFTELNQPFKELLPGFNLMKLTKDNQASGYCGKLTPLGIMAFADSIQK